MLTTLPAVKVGNKEIVLVHFDPETGALPRSWQIVAAARATGLRPLNERELRNYAVSFPQGNGDGKSVTALGPSQRKKNDMANNFAVLDEGQVGHECMASLTKVHVGWFAFTPIRHK